jgi:hypothetical protein
LFVPPTLGGPVHQGRPVGRLSLSPGAESRSASAAGCLELVHFPPECLNLLPESAQLFDQAGRLRLWGGLWGFGLLDGLGALPALAAGTLLRLDPGFWLFALRAFASGVLVTPGCLSLRRAAGTLFRLDPAFRLFALRALASGVLVTPGCLSLRRAAGTLFRLDPAFRLFALRALAAFSPHAFTATPLEAMAHPAFRPAAKLPHALAREFTPLGPHAFTATPLEAMARPTFRPAAKLPHALARDFTAFGSDGLPTARTLAGTCPFGAATARMLAPSFFGKRSDCRQQRGQKHE